MATIYNSDLTKELIDGAKIQISRDVIPSQIAEKVVPVLEVNPKLLRRINTVKNLSSNASGALTIYTTPTDRDFFLVGYQFSSIKDAASDNVLLTLNATLENNEAVSIFYHRSITLTANVINESVMLPIPMRLARGSAITSVGSFTVGNLLRAGTIFGYIVENINA